MTFEQIITDIGAGLAAVAAVATILAHLPFLPAKYAEFFARLALYASNAKFSVNQRDTLPKDPAPPTRMFPSDPPPPPSIPPLSAAAFLIAMCFAFHVQACAPAKPPCDQARLAATVAVCTAKSQDCVSHGIPQYQCPSLAECDAEIEKACGQ